jgi:hypothetical protein
MPIGAEISVKTYPGHENDTVDTHAPLLAQHAYCFTPKLSCLHCSLPGFLGFDEGLRLGEADAYETNCNRDTGCARRIVSDRRTVSNGIVDSPAIQNTVFQVSVPPPTPRLAHAANTYPIEYPC